MSGGEVRRRLSADGEPVNPEYGGAQVRQLDAPDPLHGRPCEALVNEYQDECAQPARFAFLASGVSGLGWPLGETAWRPACTAEHAHDEAEGMWEAGADVPPPVAEEARP